MIGDSRSPQGEPLGKEMKSRHSSFAGEGGGATLNFRFEGRVIAAREGQSVAAALIAAGIRSWRVDEVRPSQGSALLHRLLLRMPLPHRRRG